MAQVWKVRLPDGRTLIPGDWTSAEPLYSTVEIPTGPFSVFTAFSYGQGGDVPGSIGPRESNLADTNLQGEGNRLPENEELIVYNLAIEVFKIGTSLVYTDAIPQADAPDVEVQQMTRLQRDLLAIFRIASVKEYTRSPMSYWPASTGVQLVTSGAQSTSGFGYVVANNGGTSAFDVRTLASPLYVAGGETIALDFKPGPGEIQDNAYDDNCRLRLRTFLDGYRRRPVA